MIRRPDDLKVLIPIASMGDIAFLLIIFFVLTSTFVRQSNIQVDYPRGQDVQNIETSPLVVSLDQNGVLWVGGVQTSPEALGAQLSRSTSAGDGPPVHVSIDREITRRDFMPLLEALSAEVPGAITFLGEQQNE